MSENKIKIILKFIKDFLSSKKIKVDKLILFGSYAKMTQNKNSDMDIAIISRDFENKDIFKRAKMLTGLDWDLVKRFKIPFDVVPVSFKEWQQNSSLLVSFIREGKEIKISDTVLK